MKRAGDGAQSGIEMAKGLCVLGFGYIKLEYESAIRVLPDVTLALKSFATFVELTKHNRLAVQVDCATPEGVNCFINFHALIPSTRLREIYSVALLNDLS